MKMVLQRCLEEIDNCRPLFFGIIGERYGWRPQIEDISSSTFEEYPFVLPLLQAQKSITEIEMIYGALEPPVEVCSVFYIKKELSTSTEINCLKEKILKNSLCSSKEYL